MAASGSGSSTAPAPTSSDGMNPVPFLFIDLLLRHLFIPKEKVFPHWFYPRTILVPTMVSASLEHRSSSGKKDDQIRCGSKSRDGLFSHRKEIESLTLAQLRKTAESTGFLSAARFAARREQKERKGPNPVGFNLTLNAKRNSPFFWGYHEGLARAHRMASRPLDGGVLSRGRARAPARSHVVAPSSLIHQHSKQGIKKEKDDRERWSDLARRSAPSSASADCRGGAP